jgi:hypothetical protein
LVKKDISKLTTEELKAQLALLKEQKRWDYLFLASINHSSKP